MIVLTSNQTFPSARLLRDKLEEITDLKFPLTANPKKKCTVAVRYGNTCGGEKIQADTELNSAEFIRTISDKKIFADLLIQNKIAAPVFSSEPRDVTFPAMIRTTLRGHGGYGIIVCGNEQQFEQNWRRGYFWTPFVNLVYEYRVHVLGGEIRRVFKKVLPVEENGERPEFPIRNNEFCHFSLMELKEGRFGKLYELVNKLTEIFGNWNFYALDVGLMQDKNYFVLEANSAPGLNENTAGIYAEFIASKLREKGVINE